jgi:iron(III) transport system permease protein
MLSLLQFFSLTVCGSLRSRVKFLSLRDIKSELIRLLKDPVLLITIFVIFGLLFIFILFPLLKVFQESLSPEGGFTLKYFVEFFQKSYRWKSLYHSLVVAALVASIGTITGFIYAYTIVRTDIPLKGFFRTVAIMPIISPPFVIALGAIFLFGNHGIITESLNLNWDIYGLPGLVLTETLAYFPLAFMTLEGVLLNLDPSIEESALNLGASKLRTFFTVTLPLATPGIASALLLTFIRSLEDFGNPIVIQGNYHVLTVEAYLAITGMYNMPLGATLAIFLLVPTLMIFVVQKYWVSRKSYVTVTGKPTAGGLKSTEKCIKYPLLISVIFLSSVVLLFYGIVFFASFTKLFGVDNTLILGNFAYVFTAGAQYIKNTVSIALIATVVGGLFAMIIAYLVVRKNFIGKGLMEFTSMLNFAVPGVVVGIGYVLAFNTPPLQLTGTTIILILVFIFRRMPVGIRDGIAELQQIDPAIEEASTNLGAGFFRTFGRIVLPLISPAFLSGMIYMFVRCLTAISAVVFLVSAGTQLLTVALLDQVETALYSRAAAYAYLIIGIALVGMVLLRFMVMRIFKRDVTLVGRKAMVI